MTGAITVVAGVGGLGFIADLISKPTMIGYMNGLALTILVGQLPKLFGFSVDADGFLGEVWHSSRASPTGGPAGRAGGRAGRPGPDRGPAAGGARFPGSWWSSCCRSARWRCSASADGVSSWSAFSRRGSRRSRCPDVGVATSRPRGGRRRDRGGVAGRHDLDRLGVRRSGRPDGRLPGDQRGAGKHVISDAKTGGRRTRGGPVWAIRNAPSATR